MTTTATTSLRRPMHTDRLALASCPPGNQSRDRRERWSVRAWHRARCATLTSFAAPSARCPRPSQLHADRAANEVSVTQPHRTAKAAEKALRPSAPPSAQCARRSHLHADGAANEVSVTQPHRTAKAAEKALRPSAPPSAQCARRSHLHADGAANEVSVTQPHRTAEAAQQTLPPVARPRGRHGRGSTQFKIAFPTKTSRGRGVERMRTEAWPGRIPRQTEEEEACVRQS